jgi:hypothetical protein
LRTERDACTGINFASMHLQWRLHSRMRAPVTEIRMSIGRADRKPRLTIARRLIAGEAYQITEHASGRLAMLRRTRIGSELSRQFLPSESEVNPPLADMIA